MHPKAHRSWKHLFLCFYFIQFFIYINSKYVCMLNARFGYSAWSMWVRVPNRATPVHAPGLKFSISKKLYSLRVKKYSILTRKFLAWLNRAYKCAFGIVLIFYCAYLMEKSYFIKILGENWPGLWESSKPNHSTLGHSRQIDRQIYIYS